MPFPTIYCSIFYDEKCVSLILTFFKFKQYFFILTHFRFICYCYILLKIFKWFDFGMLYAKSRTTLENVLKNSNSFSSGIKHGKTRSQNFHHS